jgi:2,4-dienoyl-CoA reductase-like NADH-dependent reductase (Old Yellow Enzyme family)
MSLTLLDGVDAAQLFSPVSVAGLTLRNPLVMAPVTCTARTAACAERLLKGRR